jgi:hypothetical protein
MLPTAEAAELCILAPLALCLIAPVGCLAAGLFLGGLALAPAACVLCPLLCCVPCMALCCPAFLPTAGDESGPGLYTDRHPVFFTPYGPAVWERGALYDDGEVYIVNSTVFEGGAPPPQQPQRRSGGVVITELPDDDAGKQKSA